jgi:trimethylamine---corrinoid protein Co-methyltransferase
MHGNFVKLSQFFNTVHTAGGASVDALDIHASMRHLHITRNKMMYSDKVPFIYATGRARLYDGLEIIRLARGISQEQLLKEPSALHRHQHQLAAEARRAHGHGHHRDGAAQPDRRW